jgi:hypothetical protein
LKGRNLYLFLNFVNFLAPGSGSAFPILIRIHNSSLKDNDVFKEFEECEIAKNKNLYFDNFSRKYVLEII